MTQEELRKISRSLTKITSAFHKSKSDEKRVGRIIVPTTENRALLEDYISRWAWVIVQRGSEIEDAPEDIPQIAEADLALDFQAAVFELVLYGLAYLFDYGEAGPDIDELEEALSEEVISADDSEEEEINE